MKVAATKVKFNDEFLKILPSQVLSKEICA